MNIYIDLDRVCNKVIDDTLNKINPKLTLNDEDRQEVLETVMSKFSDNQDGLEYTVEELLVQYFEKRSTDLTTALTLLSLLGGKNND